MCIVDISSTSGQPFYEVIDDDDDDVVGDDFDSAWEVTLQPEF